MLISQARSRLFGSFQSLELSLGHVVSNGNLQNHRQEAPVLHNSAYHIILCITTYIILYYIILYILYHEVFNIIDLVLPHHPGVAMYKEDNHLQAAFLSPSRDSDTCQFSASLPL